MPIIVVYSEPVASLGRSPKEKSDARCPRCEKEEAARSGSVEGRYRENTPRSRGKPGATSRNALKESIA